MVDFGGTLRSVRAADGKFIDAGATVEVVGVEFGEVLVAARAGA